MADEHMGERLAVVEQRMAVFEDRQKSTEARVTHIDEELSRNTAATQAVKSDTEELIALFKGSKVVAHALKWGVGIAEACAAIWATLKGGR